MAWRLAAFLAPQASCSGCAAVSQNREFSWELYTDSLTDGSPALLPTIKTIRPGGTSSVSVKVKPYDFLSVQGGDQRLGGFWWCIASQNPLLVHCDRKANGIRIDGHFANATSQIPLSASEYFGKIITICFAIAVPKEASYRNGLTLKLRDGRDLIIAGAYGHSRLIEGLFGGASYDLVRQPSMPVLMSH
jgi:hypothetical protein